MTNSEVISLNNLKSHILLNLKHNRVLDTNNKVRDLNDELSEIYLASAGSDHKVLPAPVHQLLQINHI